MSRHHTYNLSWTVILVLFLGASAPLRADEGQATPCERFSLRGLVVDAVSGTAVAGARVTALGTTKTTGADGRFSLPMPMTVGPLTIHVEAGAGYEPLAQESTLSGETCGAEEILSVLPAEDSGEVIEMSGPRRPANQRSEALLLLERQKATTVSDAIGAEEMARTPDSSAADAVKRVVAATVVDGRYVFLRGLGGRYVTTLLNGVALPSPEPDRQAVPLDLFPTRLLANMNVIKSYDAALPGSFGGGTLAIATAAYPEEFELKLSVQTTANSEAVRTNGSGYSGGKFDALGYDDGTRALPTAVPTDTPVVVGQAMDAATAERIGESFANRWTVTNEHYSPNLSLGATLGNTIRVAGRRLGYLATATLKNSYTARNALVAKVRSEGDALTYRERMDSVIGERSAAVGGVANVGYEIAKGHDIGLFALYSHQGSDTTTVVDGFNETDSQDVTSTRLRFVERTLGFGQLNGRHRLADKVSLDWQGNLAYSGRSEPDTRDLSYNVVNAEMGLLRFKDEPGSGERFFAELDEMSVGTGASIDVDGSWVGLRAGASVQYRDRTFDARRFRFVHVGTDPNVLFLPPEQMLSSEHIGPDFQLSERTLPTDRYDASLLVAAAFASTTMHLSDSLKLVTGVRQESSRQNLDSASPFAQGEWMPVHAEQNDDSFLTAINVVYAIDRAQNLRLAYGSTLARPEFREIAPFLFFDTTRRRSVSGNPDLVNTHIHNVDLRWEWFPGATEVVAASAFGKYFVDPIEQVIVSASGGDVSYANAAHASAVGLEIEGRIDFERFSRSLAGLRVASNAALIRSRVSLTDEQRLSQTNAERPLQGQSPFAINLGLGYARGPAEANVLYNVYGRRIVEVGFDTLPDVYEQPQHRLDLSYSHRLSSDLRLKATASNLLGQRLTLQQGDLDIYRFQPGVSIGVGLDWTP